MSTLLPEGVDHLGDAPFTLHSAILMALRWLEFDQLPLDERPKKRIWLDGEAMESWWEHVEEIRKAKFKGETPVDPDGIQTNELSLVSRG